MSAGVRFLRASLIPILFVIAACEQPVVTAPDAPEASFAKGSHTPLQFAWNAGSVYSDGGGAYIDGADAGPLPVSAYISIGQGRNAYVVTYHSTRKICFQFPNDIPEVQNLVDTDQFPSLDFCAQFDQFMANGTAFLSMPIYPTGGNTDQYATWPSVELEFYPLGGVSGTDGPTYDLHFSSLRLLRTSSNTWEAITHEETETVLSAVRRKSNSKIATVDMPMSFTMSLK